MAIRKTFVNVIAEFNASGRIEPLAVILYDGRTLPVDEVLDVKRAANMKVGGAGTRYVCRIAGAQRSLWLEGSRWFVEEEAEEDVS